MTSAGDSAGMSAAAPVGPARVAAAAVCAAAAVSAVVVFSAATSYPFSRAEPPPASLMALVYVAAVVAAAGLWAGALRLEGRSWGAALTADALTYAPLALLWAVVLDPALRHAAAPLWWTALAAVGAAKAALLAGPARSRAGAIGAGAPARGVADIALWLSAVGRALAPFALVAVAVSWRLLHLYDGAGVPEQGLLAHAAQAILARRIPYRDLSSVFAPGALYLHAGMFAAFGGTLVVGNMALAAGAVLAPLAVYSVSYRIMPAGMAFAAALVAAVAGGGSLAVFLTLAAVGVGFARSGGRGANWFLAGVLLGLGAAFDVLLGLAAAVALAVMLCLRQRGFVMRRVGARPVDLALGVGALPPFAVGMVVVWAPLLVYFASRRALGSMAADLRAGLAGEVFAVLRPAPLPWVPWAVAAILAAGLALLLWRLVSRRLGEGEFIAFSVIALGAITWGWSWQRGDWYHLAQAAAPAIMTAALLFGWAAKALGQSLVGWPPDDPRRAVRAWVAALVATGVAAGCIPWARVAALNLAEVVGARPVVAIHWRPLDLTTAGGAYFPPPEAQALTAVVGFLERHSSANEPIFCAPGRPAIYFLAERPNATRIDYAYEGQVAPGDAAQAVADLVQDKTRLVVLAPPAAAWQRGLKLDPLVSAYLERRYEQAAEFGDYTVLLRKGERLEPRLTPRKEPAPPTGLAPPPAMFGPQRR